MGIVTKNKAFVLKLYTGCASLAALFIVFCAFATRLPVMRMEREAERQFATEGSQMAPSEEAR